MKEKSIAFRDSASEGFGFTNVNYLPGTVVYNNMVLETKLTSENLQIKPF